MKAQIKPLSRPFTLFVFRCAILLFGGGSSVAVSSGETLTFPLSADTSLFELDPEFNMGTQRDLPAGTLGQMGDLRRCRILLRVDFAAAGLEMGAGDISAARYRVLVTMVPESGRADSTFSLHRIHSAWEEGDKRGDIPGGQPASAGETTWAARLHPDVLWSEPGGLPGTDFEIEPSAEASVSRAGDVVFAFNARGIRDLSDMLRDPATNHGWALMTQEEGRGKTARRFAAREHRTDPPAFEIELQRPDPPESALLEVRIDWDRTEPAVVLVSATAHPDRIYRLQSSSSLESMSWQDEPAAAEFVLGRVQFRRLLSENGRFFRIVELP